MPVANLQWQLVAAACCLLAVLVDVVSGGLKQETLDCYEAQIKAKFSEKCRSVTGRTAPFAATLDKTPLWISQNILGYIIGVAPEKENAWQCLVLGGSGDDNGGHMGPPGVSLPCLQKDQEECGHRLIFSMLPESDAPDSYNSLADSWQALAEKMKADPGVNDNCVVVAVPKPDDPLVKIDLSDLKKTTIACLHAEAKNAVDSFNRKNRKHFSLESTGLYANYRGLRGGIVRAMKLKFGELGTLQASLFRGSSDSEGVLVPAARTHLECKDEKIGKCGNKLVHKIASSILPPGADEDRQYKGSIMKPDKKREQLTWMDMERIWNEDKSITC